MDNNTRATGADFYSIFAGTGITRTYPAEFDVTVENYGDDGDDGDDDFNTRCSILDTYHEGMKKLFL